METPNFAFLEGSLPVILAAGRERDRNRDQGDLTITCRTLDSSINGKPASVPQRCLARCQVQAPKTGSLCNVFLLPAINLERYQPPRGYEYLLPCPPMSQRREAGKPSTAKSSVSKVQMEALSTVVPQIHRDDHCSQRRWL